MKDGLVIRPAKQYSTIAEINEARANMVPIDYGRTDPTASHVFNGEIAPQVYIEVIKDEDVDLGVIGVAEATANPNALPDASTATWDWGDATATSSGFLVSHTYAAAGDYTVTFSITDADGDTVSVTESITVS